MKTISFNESELSLLSDAILAYLQISRDTEEQLFKLSVSTAEIKEKRQQVYDLYSKINSEEA